MRGQDRGRAQRDRPSVRPAVIEDADGCRRENCWNEDRPLGNITSRGHEHGRQDPIVLTRPAEDRISLAKGPGEQQMRVGVRAAARSTDTCRRTWHARTSCVCCIDAAIFDEGNSVDDPAGASRTMAPEVCAAGPGARGWHVRTECVTQSGPKRSRSAVPPDVAITLRPVADATILSHSFGHRSSRPRSASIERIGLVQRRAGAMQKVATDTAVLERSARSASTASVPASG
ncbi:hypothetical protein ACVIW2_000196 [Bradyrhizobium huanghuaihaiense]